MPSFSLAEIHRLRAVLQNEVAGMLVPVVFVVAQREARLLLHAQYAGQLQIMSLVLVAR